MNIRSSEEKKFSRIMQTYGDIDMIYFINLLQTA